MTSFWGELKRRNVIRVAVAYAIVSWLILQLTDVLMPLLSLPEWVGRFVLFLLIIGFLLALILSWAYELTPEGVKLEKNVDRSQSITHTTGRKLDFIIIGVLSAALLLFALDKFVWTADVAPAAITAGETRSIAVLPFVNMSPDANQEWFADGLTEEILNSLARTPDLLVSARTSSFAYKGSTEDVPTIAAALGVKHILEGSVRRSGDRLRVTAQLIRARDGFHLWSQSYDRHLADLIDIQENVAIEIASALETAMDPEALARFVSSGTDSIPAYEAYLRGLAAGVSTIASGDIYEYLDARDAYEEAIQIDSEFALAYWRLAEFWKIQLSETNITSGITELSPEQMQPLFEDAITNAIKFEPDPARKLLYRATKASVEVKLRRAVRLNAEYLKQRPNDQQAQEQQIILLTQLGKYEDVADAVQTFYKRDGYDPLVTIRSLLAVLFGGQRDEIRAFTQNAIQRFSGNINVLYQAHRAWLWVGDIDAASKILPLIQSSDMPASTRYLASLRQACAENRTDDAIQLHQRGNEQFAENASIIWLGNKIMGYEDRAFVHLLEFDARGEVTTVSSYLSYAMFDPYQFPNLMERLGDQVDDRREPQVVPYQCKVDR